MTVTARQRHLERPGSAGDQLPPTVSALRDAFRAAALPLELSGVDSLRAERAQVIEQIDDYVLPRLLALDAPALVVVGGPTGAGKSTLVNSLARRKVTTPGLLRPTTRSPVLVHHPADREWFGPDRILPTLDRVDEPTTNRRAIQLVPTPTAPRGLAILDAPDFDSIDDDNRELATKLLAAADLLLFVTSAARYSDQVPWLQLSMALTRETAVAVVMNRIPAEDRATVTPHLARMLDGKGVSTDRTFFVEQGTVSSDGVLPARHVAEIRAWLDAMAADVTARAAAVEQTVTGAVRRAVATAGPVAEAAALQVEAVSDLLRIADRVYAAEAASLRNALTDGTAVRGDLSTQWCETLGRQDVPSPAHVVGALRERWDGREPELRAQADRLGLALDLALETLVVDHAERAADRAGRELCAATHGRALLEWSDEDLSRPGRGLAARARKSIRAWREQVVGLAAAELSEVEAGPARELWSRVVAVGLALHALSGQVVDCEGAWAADSGTSDLVAAGHSGMIRTTKALLAEERDRYLRPVLDWHLAPDAPGRLRAAASEAARALVRHEKARGATP